MRRLTGMGMAIPVSRPGGTRGKCCFSTLALLSESLQETVSPAIRPTEIVGERPKRTAMHNAALIQVPVINVDFADEFVLRIAAHAEARLQALGMSGEQITRLGFINQDRCGPCLFASGLRGILCPSGKRI
jgi:hypothetical protein